MSRSELLEMLITQMEENKSLKAQLKEANAALENRQIEIEKSGSLAEAALRLSGVFEAADRAAQMYLDNLRAQDEKGGPAE